MTRLRAAPLTADAFRPFGDVIEPDNAAAIRLINKGTTTRFHDVACVDVSAENGVPLLSIFRGKPFALPVRIAMVERHPLGSQAFVPLEGRPYLVVVAPQTDGGVPGEPVAFLACGDQGVSYRRGTWHHPLIALAERSDFLVVDRGGAGENLEEYAYETPFLVEG